MAQTTLKSCNSHRLVQFHVRDATPESFVAAAGTLVVFELVGSRATAVSEPFSGCTAYFRWRFGLFLLAFAMYFLCFGPIEW